MKEKRVIKDSFIQKSIDVCRCPEPSFCTVATTMYDNHTRERMCMKCWLAYCKRNNIEIDYENQSFFLRSVHVFGAPSMDEIARFWGEPLSRNFTF